MPTFEFVRESKIIPTFRVEQVRGMFDVPEKESVRHEWRVQIPIEEKEWRIGLIVGPSGSGKSTLAKELLSTSKFMRQIEGLGKCLQEITI